MERRRRGAQDSAASEEAATGEKATRSKSLWPLYLMGGLLIAAILATTVFGDQIGRRGSAFLGDRCEETRDCNDRKAICYPVDNRHICVQKCRGPGDKCPSGYECTSIGEHKRRRKLRIRNLCLPR